MATLTETQLASLRRKVGDSAGTVWTEEELNAIYTEAGSDLNEAIAICYEELMANAVKFADYTQNESSEKRSQIFSNLGKMATYYRGLSSQSQVSARIVGMKQRPPHNKRKPGDSYRRKSLPNDWGW